MDVNWKNAFGLVRVWGVPSVVEFEGLVLTLSDERGDIQPGDTYIAGRNTGPHLLTCRMVNEELDCIHPTETAYPFDTWECRKVLSIDGEPV